ncbi:hypothetical protein NBEOAGPD_2748 [Methylobacterium gregans]|uniref:Uncharacterized protein n=1 Tax=Methylobacterium gregans TaxID=374424 RepID=A0AA37HPB7_9HYPH|nr:hypothetical protein [Methylobacterium gregans]GJD79519.1 hypothetical protein NBEOAGPD_2748 [Methylobacterium gregans]
MTQNQFWWATVHGHDHACMIEEIAARVVALETMVAGG